jgi:hypothetical protein
MTNYSLTKIAAITGGKQVGASDITIRQLMIDSTMVIVL